MKKILGLVSVFAFACVHDPDSVPKDVPHRIESGPTAVRDANGEPLAPWEGEKVLEIVGELGTQCPVDLGCGVEAGYIAFAGYVDSLLFYFSFRPEFSAALSREDARQTFNYMNFSLVLPGMRTDSSYFRIFQRDAAWGANGITSEITHTLQDFSGDTLVGEFRFAVKQILEIVSSRDPLCHIGDMMGMCIVNHPFSSSLFVRYRIKLVK